MTITVVGRGSMIAGALRDHPVSKDWTYLSHTMALAEPRLLRRASCIVNLAFDAQLKSAPYDSALDVDLRLARLIAHESVPYVMASTRMVYGPRASGSRLSEDMHARPTTHYGAGKLETEGRLMEILGDRLTILRLSNIFDQSEVYGQRRSFFGLALRRLRNEGRIIFDMSPFIERDFLPATATAERLVTILTNPRPGIFNIGAGFGIPTGRIAQWIIEGRGEGELVVTDFREFDAFWLDDTKARSAWGFLPFNEQDLRACCVAAGAALHLLPATEELLRQ